MKHGFDNQHFDRSKTDLNFQQAEKLKSRSIKRYDGGGVVNACMTGCVSDGVHDVVHDVVCDVVCDAVRCA